jgi:hypothetical protein
MLKIPRQTLISFLENNFGEIKETSTGEIRINSPYANDNKFHLYINPEKGVFNDFKSGESGSIISFISNYLSIPKNKVMSTIINEYTNRIDLKEMVLKREKLEEKTNLEIPSGLTFFSEKSTGIIHDRAWNYLENRGIPRHNILNLGYIYEPGSEYNKTIFIPFYENSNLVYYITRDFTGENFLRYNNPHGINSKNFVYNIDKIEKEVFIFEGVFDALMLGKQVGTAMLSSEIGREQIIKIWNRAPESIIFVPDSDETGKRTLNRNIKMMIKFKPPSLDAKISIYYIDERYKDFGETGKNFIDINDCLLYNRYNLINLL